MWLWPHAALDGSIVSTLSCFKASIKPFLQFIISGSEGAGGHRDPGGGRQHRAREEQPGAGAADVHPAPQEV